MTNASECIYGILVTYNPNLNELIKVLSSIQPQVDHLIIFDNGSKNSFSIADSIKFQTQVITFIQNDTNIGLADAQNIAVKMAIKSKASHILLFDQDSVIEPFFVKALLDAECELINKGESVAAVGPIFYDPISNKLYPATVYCGPFIRRIDPTDIIDATFIIASGCLIRTSVLEDIGLMKGDLFIDYIDVEWSLRAKNMGYRVFISPKAKMAHSIGDRRISVFGRQISVHSPIRRYYLLRNSFYMVRLPYVPFGYKLRESVFNFLRLLFGYFSSENRKDYLYYAYHGIKDGIRGKFGAFERIEK